MRYRKETVFCVVIGVCIIRLERQKGRSILHVIHNASFDQNDHSVNHKFIIEYFKDI